MGHSFITRHKIDRLILATVAMTLMSYILWSSSGKEDHERPTIKPAALKAFEESSPPGDQMASRRSHIDRKSYKMGTARRNQECLVIGEGSESIVMQIGGLNIPNVEYLQIKTGEVTTIESEMINLNHFAMVEREGLLYCVCSLKGDGKYTYGTPSENMIIYDRASNIASVGPRYRVTRKECGAVKFDNFVVKKQEVVRVEELVSNETFSQLPDSWTEDVICMLGGSTGYHDLSTYTDVFDCYSFKAGGWIVLPKTPLQLDHLNTNKMQQIMPDGTVEDVIIMNSGRLGNYTAPVSSVYRFSMSTYSWQFLFNASIPRSAGCSAIVFNRYLMIFGGVSHRTGGSPGHWTHSIYNDIDVCDLEQRKCHLIGKMDVQRFALRACLSKNQKDIYICGGTDDGVRNVQICEYFSTMQLIEIFMNIERGMSGWEKEKP